MAAKKPTKQQIAQAKARAGGNTTSKTTPARMAKGAKDIALFAATIAGPGKVAKAAKAVSKARDGYKVSSKSAQKIGDKISGTSSKKVQQKLNDIAGKDWKDTAQRNPDMTGEEAYIWSKHPAMVSRKGFEKGVNKGKTVTDRQSVRYRKAEDKAAAKANARGLKAANKPTKASKTFEGNNKKISVQVRRRVLKNMEPARPNRERGGNLDTLRRQGKTGK